MDNLIKLQETFQRHHKMKSENDAKRKANYILTNGCPPPSYPDEDFSIAEALAYICESLQSCMKNLPGEKK